MTSRQATQRIATALAATAAALAAVGAAGGPASAAGKRWTQITASNGSSLDQVGLARTDDRVLKIAWIRRRTALSSDLVVTPLRRDGRGGSPATVVSNWVTVSPPALLRTGATSLALLFGGQRTTNVGEVYDGLTQGTSADGRTWTLAPAALAGRGSFGAPVGAALGPAPARTIFVAWSAFGNAYVRPGLAPATAALEYAPARCCTYNANVAVDGVSGQAVLAYDSNATGDPGRHLRALRPDGTAAAPPVVPPGATVLFSGQKQALQPAASRSPLVGRPRRPGIFTAFVSGYVGPTRVLVWRLGARRSIQAGRSVAGYALGSVGLAAAPSGRIWVFWAEKGAKNPSGVAIVARRSNRAATRFGPRLVIAPPRGTNGVWQAAGNAQTGPLDLLLTVSRGTSNDAAAWHRQFITGVSLFPRPRTARPGQRVRFQVTDAGDPVRGARVRFGSRSGRTNAKGVVTLPAPATTTVATVAARGYGAARARVTVRR